MDEPMRLLGSEGAGWIAAGIACAVKAAGVLTVAGLVAYGLNAPRLVGDLFLVAMVALGVVGFIVGARGVNRFKHNVRVAQRSPAREKEPWDD